LKGNDPQDDFGDARDESILHGLEPVNGTVMDRHRTDSGEAGSVRVSRVKINEVEA
jgi:hypothetical protein